MGIKRFEVYFADLDPTVGSEIKKTRPCLVISPDDVNRVLNTVIVAPITSTIRNYPTRVNCYIAKKNGQIVIDQLRAVDKLRLSQKLGSVDSKTSENVLNVLHELFSK